MITRTYINKINTLISDSTYNTGINPISEMVYGANKTRMILFFDHEKIKGLYQEKIFPDLNKMKHYLHVTNAGSLDFSQLHTSEISSISDVTKIRASSFDLIFFLVPQEWDGGKGFDYTETFFNQGYYGKNCGANMQDTKKLLSTDGSNWYQARNGYFWGEEGIYSTDTLSKEYDKFSSGEESIIIGRQHFDIGNENIKLDITDVFNKFIEGVMPNYGIGVAFAPNLENTDDGIEHYCGFLTHKTNTFFEPYVETVYCDNISDDRAHFILGKKNRLYLYCNIGGELTNLDVLPSCTVDNVEYEVKQFSKGIYYIDIKLTQSQYKPNTMLFDIWDNLIYNGEKLESVEMDFVVKQSNHFFNIGNTISESKRFVPTIYGINYDEVIQRGDIRKLVIHPLVPYKKNSAELIDNVYVRLYIKDGEREIDVMQYEKANKSFNEIFYLVDTSILIPQRYHIDVKIISNQEVIMHHNILSFKISDNLNNKYA